MAVENVGFVLRLICYKKIPPKNPPGEDEEKKNTIDDDDDDDDDDAVISPGMIIFQTPSLAYQRCLQIWRVSTRDLTQIYTEKVSFFGGGKEERRIKTDLISAY